MQTPNNTWRRVGTLAAGSIAALLTGAALLAQDAPPPSDTPPGRPETPPAATPAHSGEPPEEVRIPLKLGGRAEVVRRNIKVSPTVVLVSSPDDFVKVMTGWSLNGRYPILIDDGTDRAREDIARFVRAFEPESVVRFGRAKGDPMDARLPEDRSHRRALIDAAFRRAWGAASPDQLAQVWAQTRFIPPGVVVASDRDPAWTAALALAAGHGQPIVWVDEAPLKAGSTGPLEEVDLLQKRIIAALEDMKTPGGWRELGDDIDAVTLCLNFPSRFPGEKGDMALTDRIGRRENGARYAWCGQVFGDEASSLYRAMCSLFLQPRAAWLFDGYKEGFAEPYQIGPAIQMLEKAGLRVSTNLPPRAGLEQWRQRTSFGVSAELIHVNSSGLARWFDLAPGRATTADVPLLARPAIVHFIHSFSAQNASDPATIAGRWIENGAYAYYGSVAEPYLSAFVPAPVFAARLLAGMPFGAAVRIDGGREWKLNVYADPLLTLGPAATRMPGPLEMNDTTRLDDHMRAALSEKKLAEGAADLIMLGRDADAVRLVHAAVEEGALTPELARVAFFAAARRSDKDLLFALFGALSTRDRQDPVRLDTLWQAARADLPTTTDDRLLTWLRSTPRPDSLVDDAETLAPALARVLGRPAAQSYLALVASRATDEKVQKRLNEMAGQY